MSAETSDLIVTRVSHELETMMPKGWKHTVRTTKNTLVVTAKRPRNEGTYRMQTDRQHPIADVRDFIGMCRMFAGIDPEDSQP